MLNKYILHLFLIILLFAACAGKTVNIETSKPYFDLKYFLVQKATVLNSFKIKTNKTVVFEGDSETKKTQTNWKDEWKVFIDSDINKTAYIGKYQIDSSANQVKYTALDADLKTQEIVLFTNNNEVIKVTIANQTNNVLYQSKEQLLLDVSKKTYEIVRNQKIILGENKEVVIRGQY